MPSFVLLNQNTTLLLDQMVLESLTPLTGQGQDYLPEMATMVT